MRLDRHRLRYIRGIVRQGPTETGYAFFRALRRRRNVGDEQPALLPSDRIALDPSLDASTAELEANAELLRAQRERERIEVGSIQWFVPAFYLAWAGGIHTVLRLADLLARTRGVESRFCVFDSSDPRAVARVREAMAEAFPRLRAAEVSAADSPLRPCDLAIATSWESAWRLVRFGDTRAKLFLVQDWEPDFHPAGSARGMLEQVARLGLPAIANTEPLARSYRELGNAAAHFVPAVDTRVFHPPARRPPPEPVRIVFYGRPRTSRNAFGLAAAALRRVKERFGDRVQIVSAGETWSPGQYGLGDVLENAGMLESLEEVAALYRSCHIGLVFMFTRHPSYQPLEFMASGVATVSNENAYSDWLLRHEDTALLAPAVPALVAEQLGRLVEDGDLRERLARAGLAQATQTDWDAELEQAWRAATGAPRSAAPPG